MYLFITLICMASCSSSNDNSGNDDSQSSLAPSSLNGKVFSCPKIESCDCTTSKTFSNSTFSVTYVLRDDQTIGTPTYTYTRSGNTATMKMSLKTKTYVGYGNSFTLSYMYDLKLTFTSENDGYLSGTIKTTDSSLKTSTKVLSNAQFSIF